MARFIVRVTPRASRNGIDGWGLEGELRLRVTAPPADGSANTAVSRLLADVLGLPARDVLLVSGVSSRLKTFEVPLDLAVIRDRVNRSLP